MIGTFVNVGTIIIGSLLGGLVKKIISQRINDALFNAMGLAAFGLGINAVVQNMPNTSYPVLFIASLAILNIKDCKTLNFIPALFVPVIWCLLAGSML